MKGIIAFLIFMLFFSMLPTCSEISDRVADQAQKLCAPHGGMHDITKRLPVGVYRIQCENGYEIRANIGTDIQMEYNK